MTVGELDIKVVRLNNSELVYDVVEQHLTDTLHLSHAHRQTITSDCWMTINNCPSNLAKAALTCHVMGDQDSLANTMLLGSTQSGRQSVQPHYAHMTDKLTDA